MGPEFRVKLPMTVGPLEAHERESRIQKPMGFGLIFRIENEGAGEKEWIGH